MTPDIYIPFLVSCVCMACAGATCLELRNHLGLLGCIAAFIGWGIAIALGMNIAEHLK